MTYLPNRLVLGLAVGLALSASGCFWEDCRWNEDLNETWNRQLTVTENFSVFPDSGVGADSSIQQGAYGTAEVYSQYPREDGRSVATTPPRAIRLSFQISYSGPRLLTWNSGGLFAYPFADTTSYHRGMVLHEIIVDSIGMTVGTIPFSLADTVGSIRLSNRFFSLSAVDFREFSDSLVLTGFSGSITVTEPFTKNSGAFTYQVEVEYLPGQKSTFAGAVSFDGVTHSKRCVDKGVVVD